MTNEEKVVKIMNFSKYGALSQIFVMQALEHFCDLVIEQESELIKEQEKCETEGKISMINLKSWVGVANEIKEKIN